MEIEFVWSSPWGFVKVLYIVQRYLPFFDAIFLCLTREYLEYLSLSLYDISPFFLLDQLAVNISPDDCHIVEMIRGCMHSL